MKLTIHAALWLGVCSIACTLTSARMGAQTFTTTTVQGTVYLANGRPGSGTLQLSWPAFTTAGNQAVTAGRTNVTIGADGYVSVNLAPNLGSSPAGLYYTAVYHLSDGTTSTEYWVVPAAAQANLSQVRAQVMPAAQAVQAVSKGYVDQSISELTQSLLTASGGSLSGPLFLNGDPAQPTQAATKRYVDSEFSQALPLSGGVVSGPLTSVQLGAAYQVDQFPGADFGAKLQACLNALNGTYGGTCDARNFSGVLAMGSAVTVTTANATVQLPCATIATANQIRITAGTRNVTLHGCALRGASDASGSQGGTVFLYSGPGPMIQVGDPTYTTNTVGFHLDNVVINTTASTNPTAVGFTAFRAQELDLESLYLLGNSNQTGMTLDGTGNYTGGTFQDIEFGGFGTALSAVGHQVSNSATTDWVNASAFLRLHINCPTSGGSPTHGTYGIDLVQGDGNTFTGGDVEGCATALHLGQNAQNNTIVGLRNENSINQVVADAGSSYNNWMTGGTMFTGQLTDNGTRNSFLDTFHRSFNGLNGDWYGSQKDATVTNHYRIGTGTGNERGLLDRYQTDWGYRWTTGLSDATAGAQFYQVLDELNNVYRLSIGQHNPGQPSANDQTVINAAGAGAVVLNGSANAGTGGVIFGAGGASGAAVATINSAGNAQFNGSLQVGGPSTFTNSTTVKNQSDAEIDSVLWAGSTANQKESVIYKDYTGASQWYMVKDATNNWALNSALGGVDSFKAYQSNNSGDTYVNASNSGGHIRLNYETGSGAETDIYSGTASSLVAAFLGTNAIKFPGLASGSGRNCLQIDNSGYISNTGMACGTGNGMNGTVNTGNSGQVAYYVGNGTVIAGTSSVAIGAGGTGATTPQQALQNLGGQRALPGVNPDGASGMTVSGTIAANTVVANGSVWAAAVGRHVIAANHTQGADGGIMESYNSAECPDSGCTIETGQDITITSPQTLTFDGAKSVILDCNGGAIHTECTSGNCLSITKTSTTLFSPIKVQHCKFDTHNTTTAFTGVYAYHNSRVDFVDNEFSDYAYAGGTNPAGTSGQLALNLNNHQDSIFKGNVFNNNNRSEQLDNTSDNITHEGNQYRYGCAGGPTGEQVRLNSGNHDRWINGNKLESDACQSTFSIYDTDGSVVNPILGDIHFEQLGGSLTNPCNITVTVANGNVLSGLSITNAQLTSGAAGYGLNSTFVCNVHGTGGGRIEHPIWRNLSPGGYTVNALQSGFNAGEEPIEENIFPVGPYAFSGTNNYMTGLNVAPTSAMGRISGLSFNPIGGNLFSITEGTGVNGAAHSLVVSNASSGTLVSALSFDPATGWWFPGGYQYGATCNGSLTLPVASAYTINLAGNCTLTLPSGNVLTENPIISFYEQAPGGYTVAYTNLHTYAGAIPPINTASTAITSYQLVYNSGGPYWTVTSTVSSVALTGGGSLFSATPGTPVTTAGSLNMDAQLQPQSAHCVVAGPSSGANAAPTCRALVVADLPVGTGSFDWFANGLYATTAGKALVQNKTVYFDFNISAPITVGGITYFVQTADNTANTYGAAVYAVTGGAPLLTTGSVAGTSFVPTVSVPHSQAFTGSATLLAGTYIIAFTTNCASGCAVLGGSNNTVSYARFDNASNATTGGVPTSTLSVVSPNYALAGTTTEWWFMLHP